MKSNIEENYWFNNKQVISIIVGVAFAVFYGTSVYMNFLQLRTEHDADLQHIEDVHVSDLQQNKRDIEVLDQRLNKKIDILNDLEGRVDALETYIKVRDGI